jgi:hypothetical protein
MIWKIINENWTYYPDSGFEKLLSNENWTQYMDSGFQLSNED